MSFTVDTGHGGVLSWASGRFDGDESSVQLAQQFVAEGHVQPLTPTGPDVKCRTRPERNAWACALAVCAVIGVDPGPIPAGARDPGDSVPPGVDA